MLLSFVPQQAGNALDVGCGDGTFAAALASRCRHVLALDSDQAQVKATRDTCAHLPQVSVRQADFLTANLPDEEFDVVTALAAFHHMPFIDGAREVQRVLKPGGRLIVLGVWTGTATADLPLNVASAALNGFLQLRRGPDTMNAPTTPDQTSWPTVKNEASKHLPGARLRRHLLWRYTLIWDKPINE